MVNFAVLEVVTPNKTCKFFKLERDGKCMYDEFIEDVKEDANISKELSVLYAIAESASKNQLLPKTKYRKLKTNKQIKYSIYEAKSNNLRLYMFHEESTGKVFILGGKKKTQDKDIERVEKIIKEFQEYKSKNQ